MTEIRLPQYGMGMSDGTIIAWHKQEGQHVAQGDILCEIEAAKTTVELESPASGILRRILVQIQENVPVNTVIAEIDADAHDDATPSAAPPTVEAATGVMEDARKSLREEADIPPSVTVVTDEQRRASPLAKRAAQDSGVDLTTVRGSGARGRIMHDDVKRAQFVASTSTSFATDRQVEPRARQAARDLKIDLACVRGTGPGGRVTAEDVASHVDAKPAATTQPPAAPAEQPVLAEGAKPPLDKAEPSKSQEPPGDLGRAAFTETSHSMMRRTIARRLTESKQQIPHFYVKCACAIDDLLRLRADLNGSGGHKVSVNDLVVRAVALALIEIPDANVAWTEKTLRRFHHVDVAIAVATPRGLVTPILRQVEAKPIRQISAETVALATRAREGKLKPEEYNGGQVTVSNLGMFGVEEFSAILNPPQAAIFAIGAGEPRPIVRDGRVEVATLMTVTLSVDHRAVDGAVAAQMLAAFKRLIEKPVRILA